MKAIKTAGSKAEKKVMRFNVFVTFLILLASLRVDAQIDPSSAMLLNTNRAAVRDGGLDSGRYTVKPRSGETTRATTHKTTETPKPRDHADDVAPTPTPVASPTPTPQIEVQPAVLQSPSPTPLRAGPESPTFTPQNDDGERDDDAAQDSGDNETQSPITTKVQRDERRFTMLELSFSPGYLYNESKSTFAPRNYFVNSPTMSVDAGVWTSPNFGVHTNFLGTLNASVTDSLNNTKNAAASEQWFSVGARARGFFGDGSLAPTLQLGLDYREYQFRVPSDTVTRNKLMTSGLILLLDAEIPTSGLGAWVFGAEFGPRLSHAESSNAVEFRTGEDPQTTSVGVHVGAHYRFDHTQSVFWKVSYGVEKNLFNGSTTVNDPITGLPEANVSVTNSFALFQLGYTWAD